jgi:hypothetical protein
MTRQGWGGTLRGILLRWVVQSAGAAAVLGAIGFALGGWLGARNGAVFGLMAGALALPFMLQAMVDLRGGGVEDAGHEAFYKNWYGVGPREPEDR